MKKPAERGPFLSTTADARLGHDDGSGVSGKRSVRRNECQTLVYGLCEEQPVERILVHGRQRGDAEDMLAANRQLVVAVLDELAT